MKIKAFYNFSDYITGKELALRDGFWGPLIPKHRIPSPNFLTIIRIIGAIFLVLIPLKGVLFFSIIIILFLTDYFDGIIARTQNKETQFGIWADPTADKLLLVSIIYFLYLQDKIFWADKFIEIFIPEVVILLLGPVLFFQGVSITPKPNAWARLKFSCYCLAVIIFLWGRSDISNLFITAGIVLAYMSILAYSSRLRFKKK